MPSHVEFAPIDPGQALPCVAVYQPDVEAIHAKLKSSLDESKAAAYVVIAIIYAYAVNGGKPGINAMPFVVSEGPVAILFTLCNMLMGAIVGSDIYRRTGSFTTQTLAAYMLEMHQRKSDVLKKPSGDDWTPHVFGPDAQLIELTGKLFSDAKELKVTAYAAATLHYVNSGEPSLGVYGATGCHVNGNPDLLSPLMALGLASVLNTYAKERQEPGEPVDHFQTTIAAMVFATLKSNPEDYKSLAESLAKIQSSVN